MTDIVNKKNHNDEISLGDIWNNIWNNKFTVIIVTLLLSVFLILGVFIYNKNTRVIVNKFNYEFLGIKNDIYPDGSNFDFHDLISKEHLTSIVEGSNTSKYKEVNISNLLLNKDLNIKRIIKYNDNNMISESYLEVTLPLKEFNNDLGLAENFLSDIHESAIKAAKEKNNNIIVRNYFSNIQKDNIFMKNNLDDLTYSELTNLIKLQMYDLEEQVNSIVNDKNIKDFISETNHLKQVYSDIKFWYDSEVLIELVISEISSNMYVRNYEKTLRAAKLNYNSINKEISRNKEIIAQLTTKYDELLAGSSTKGESNLLLEEITKNIIRNVDLNVEKERYQDIINNPIPTFNEVFDNELINNANELGRMVDLFNTEYLKILNGKTVYTKLDDKYELEIVKTIDIKTALLVIVSLSSIIGITAGLIKESIYTKKSLENEGN